MLTKQLNPDIIYTMLNITRKSPITGTVNTMTINATQDQLDRYNQGEDLIQNIFPHLTPSEREFIKTGITDEEWETMFGGDNE